jgi:uncharacterized membrane protein SirB2
MSYEIYKVIHLVSLITLVACLAVNFFSETPRKLTRIGSMVASLLLMVAGMGLLARTRIGWPSWVIAKMVIWLILAVSAPMMAKRLKDNKGQGFVAVLVMLVVAISLAVFKP